MPAQHPNDEQTLPTPRSPVETETEETRVRPQEPTVRLSPDGPPTVLGYELLREIARGGMGVVYVARDIRLDREVAIKVMLPGMDAAAFVRESRITARLPHPGVPPVHALGTLDDGCPFLAMKLIKGETLDRLLRGRATPTERRERLLVAFEQMCQTVGFAHAQGIVHRDLKPSNVMVGAFGEVQVMDWGLAKIVGASESTVADGAISEDVAATVAGQIKGTPAYMAPEQARGEPVDTRSDVFALGGVLAAILTGKPPFAGNSVLDTIIQAASAELDAVYGALDGSGADDELVELAKWCLAPRAEDRPANGEQVAAVVATYRAGVESRLRRAEQERAAAEARAAEELNTRREAEARVAEQRKRRRVQLALISSVVLCAGLIGLGAWWEDRQAAQRTRDLAESEARNARTEAARLAAENAAEARNAQNAVARANTEAAARKTAQRQMIDLCGASGLAAARDEDHAMALLWFTRAVGLARDEPPQQELNRTRITNWLRSVCLPEETFTVPNYRQDRDSIETVQFSPDGTYLLVVARPGGCLVWDRARGQRVELPPSAAGVTAAAWVPKSGALALVGKDARVSFLSPPEFRPSQEEGPEVSGAVTVLTFSRDGKRLAWGGTAGARAWDRETKAHATPLLAHGGPVVSLSFSASGELLATAARDSKARVFRIAPETGAPLFPPVEHRRVVPEGKDSSESERLAPRFADDDQVLVTVAENRLVWHSTTTGQSVMSVEARYLTAFAVSPDGTQVAAVWDGSGKLWDARTRAPLATIPQLRYNWCDDLRFMADGKALVVGDRTGVVQFWSVGDRPNDRLSVFAPSVFLPVSTLKNVPSPDGRHLATARWDGNITLWRMPDGPPVAYTAQGGWPTLPVVSPDGRFVVPRSSSFRNASQQGACVYQADSGAGASSLLAPDGILVDAAFSPDGAHLACACLTARTPKERRERIFEPDGKAGNVQVWDWKSGRRIAGPVPLPGEPRGLAYRPGGRTLAVVCADYRVVLLDPQTGKVIHELDPGVRSRPADANLWWSNGEARFSPDGRFLVTWEMAPAVHVWDPDRGRLLHTLPHSARAQHVAFSPVSSGLLATAGRDSRARVWNLETGKQLADLQHPRPVIRLRFSPDGTELLTGCDDGQLRVWDWQAGTLKFALPLHQLYLQAFDFTPDYRRLVTVGVEELQVSDWPTRAPLCPTWKLRDAHNLSMELVGNRRVVVGGFSPALVAYDLEAMTAPMSGAADDLLTLAELVAGRRILDSGNIVPLSSSDWAQRWSGLQRNDDLRKLLRARTDGGGAALPAPR